jgi:hypothetical protein
MKKNEIMSFAWKQVELEIITLSEINQTKKYKYHVFSHIRSLDLKTHESRRGTIWKGPAVGRGKIEGDVGVDMIEVQSRQVWKNPNETHYSVCHENI